MYYNLIYLINLHVLCLKGKKFMFKLSQKELNKILSIVKEASWEDTIWRAWQDYLKGNQVTINLLVERLIGPGVKPGDGMYVDSNTQQAFTKAVRDLDDAINDERLQLEFEGFKNLLKEKLPVTLAP